MGVYFVFDAGPNEHFASLYLSGCKKYLTNVAPPSLCWLEVGVKNYLREEFLISSDKKQYSVFLSSDSETERAVKKAAAELKRGMKPYPTTIVVYGATEVSTFKVASYLANLTGAKLFFYPLKIESLTDEIIAEFTALTFEEQGKNKLEKIGYRAVAIESFLPMKSAAAKPLLPCPPATIGSFVLDEYQFENFKNLLKAAARIENARLSLFTNGNYASKLRDYADLTNTSSILAVFEDPDQETLFSELSRTNFVVSFSISLLPLEAIFSVCSLRPILSLDDSPAAFAATKTYGLTFPVAAEETIYEVLVRFIERYDLLEFEKLEQEAKKLASFTSLTERLESLRQT